MSRFLKALVCASFLFSVPAVAQQKPLVTMSGQTRQLPSGTTLGVQPSTTGAASLNIPQGTAPSSPTNGDVWVNTSGIYVRANGSSIGPMAGLSNNQSWTGLQNFQNWLPLGSVSSVLTAGTLQYATVQNTGPSGYVGGNYAALQFSNDPSTAFYGCYKNRQTTKGTGGVAVQPGDDICELQGSGWDGADYNVSATLDFAVDGTVSTGVVPSNATLWLGSSTSSGISGNTLVALWDSRANYYVRNGNIGIGAAFGYNPPSYYSAGTAPPYPLSISKSTAGTFIGAYYTGSSGGGAQIQASNGFSSTVPIYGYWSNSASGIGNPAANVTSVITSGTEALRVDSSRNLIVAGTTPYARTTLNGSIAFQAPVYTSSTSYSVGSNDYSVIFTAASTVTVTLPTASGAIGRILKLKNSSAISVNSASSNVAPLTGAVGTAILAATAGKWAELQSDGTNWVILSAN